MIKKSFYDDAMDVWEVREIIDDVLVCSVDRDFIARIATIMNNNKKMLPG